MPLTTHALSVEDVEVFHREGYLILESFIESDYNQRLRDELDQKIADQKQGVNRLPVTYPAMGGLTSYPPMMDMVESLMGPRFAMHHIHASRHDAGAPGVCWHQDYEQVPQTNRSHTMVHVFYYLSGLNGEVGDLLFVPKSHTIVLNDRMLGIFGTEDLPGSVCVDALPPGSAVIVHSALWHARRPKPGGEDKPRHFIDVSYCQHGIVWPPYPRCDEVNRLALEHGHDREGRYAHLYDSSQFFNRAEADQKLKAMNQGSLALHLKDH